jgi:hypothetical protein
MSQEYDALPKRDEFPNNRGRHKVVFTVEGPPDLPSEFVVFLSREEYDQIAEHSDYPKELPTQLGAVPVEYNNGWEIAWDSLEGYSYGSR